MSRISADKIETLLHMPESQTLDFKAAQYPVAGASAEQKAELVKDILAFANAWKDADAYILIGVQENAAPPATVVGGIEHVDDATLQELVNKKTNRPVHFDYIPLEYDGKSLAAVRIRKEQDRPIFLQKQFGRLEADAVYVRRGSSTFKANPDEVAKMGRAASEAAPVLKLGVREHERRGTAGPVLTLVSHVLDERPPIPPEERIDVDAFLGSVKPSMITMNKKFSSPTLHFLESIKPSREEIRRFLMERALLKTVIVEVSNPGQLLARDVRVELRFPAAEGLHVREEPAEQPRNQFARPIPRLPVARHTGTWLARVDDEWEVSIRLGKIQPGTSAISDPFWIGCEFPLEIPVSASVVGDNFSPIASSVRLVLNVERGWLEDAEEEYARSGAGRS